MTITDSEARPSPVIRFVPPILILGMFVLLVRRLAAPLENSDTYFHLRLGREFLDGWSPRDPGSVSRFATGDWLPTQWLGQVTYAFFEDKFGLAGVAWLSGTVVLTFALVLVLAVRRQGSLLVASFIVPLVVIACWPALSGRPQVLSYLFTALITAAWLDTRRTGRVAWWIIPMTWVWAMVHGMWSVGVLVSVVAILGIVLDRGIERPSILKMLTVPLLSSAVAALTPVGPALYGSIVRVGSISGYFAEWAAPDFSHPTTAVAALMMVFLLCLTLRSGPVPWSRLCLVLLAGAWILYSNRTVPVGATMLAPLLAVEVSRLLPVRPPSRREVPITVGGFVLALVVLALAVPYTSIKDMHSDNEAHASVAALPPGTGLLNEWGLGGYDMWRHPHLDIVMHGYGDMFTAEEIQRNFELGALDAGWVSDLEELDVRDALLSADSRLAYALVTVLGWEELVEDDGLVHLRAPTD